MKTTFSISEAARAIGCTPKTVRRACYKDVVGSKKVAGRNGLRWTLTRESIAAIDLVYKPCLGNVVEETAKRFKAGESVDALAHDYGVKRATIIKRLSRAGCSSRYVKCEE